MSALRSASKTGQLNEALAVLNKIGQTLIATQDSSGILQKITQHARDVLRADIVDLYEYIQSDDEFVLPPILIGTRRHRHIPKEKIYADDVVMKVVKAGKPKYFPEAQAATLLTGKFKVKRADAPDKRFVTREGVLSSVSIPLQAGRETVGVMFVNYRTKQSFDDEQKNLIESFSNLAAIAIFNSRLYKAEHDRRQLSDFQAQALDKLSRLSQRLVSIREEHENLRDLLNEIAQNAKEVLRADIIELYEYSHLKKSYELPQISVGESIFPIGPKQKVYDDDAVLQLIDRDQPSYIENSQADDSIASDYTIFRADMPTKRFATREKIQSTAAIPLKAGDEPVGLMFANYRTKQEFTTEQRELIELFANQAAIAIYNARLYRAERDRRQALARLSQLSQRLVSIGEEHGNVRDLLNEIAQSAKEVLRADIIELYEYLHSKRTYELPQISVGERKGPFVSKQEIYQDDSVLQLIDRDQPSYIENSQIDDSIGSDYKVIRPDMPAERFAIREKIQSTAAIPLKAGDEPVGLMFANYRVRQEFTAEQKELIELFANQAAIAIQNARLYKQLNRKIEDLNVLSKIGQQLTANMRLQEKEILELVHQQASKLMDADNMYIALYDEKPDNTIRFGLAFEVGTPITIQPRKIDDAKRGRTEEIIRTKQPIFIPTRDESKKWYQQPGHTEIVPMDLASWIGVPMMAKQKVVGVIAAYHPTEDNIFSKDDLNILQAMADQAAIALDNSRTFQALVDFGQKVSAGIGLQENEVLKLIYEQASKLMDTDNMYIALYDEKPSDTIRFGLALKNGKPISVATRKIDETRRGRTEEIIRTKQAIFNATFEESIKWYQQPGRTEFTGDTVWKSWIGVPMMAEDKVLGVVATYHPTEDNVYSEGDVRILQSMANIAAVALENARKYGELEDANTRIAQKEAILVRSMIASDFVHRLNNLAGTIPVWVDLVREGLTQTPTPLDEISGYLDKIWRDADDLLRAAEQLNDMPRKQQVDVAFVLQSMLRQIRIQYRKSITVSETIQPELYKVSAIPFALTGALSNVVSNGVDAMMEMGGGTLTVNACNDQGQDGKQGIRIEIKDTGPGILDEYMDKLFVPFLSTKGEGRGYGLWRAKTVIEELGGNIQVKSPPGGGATFTLWLPKPIQEESNVTE